MLTGDATRVVTAVDAGRLTEESVQVSTLAAVKQTSWTGEAGVLDPEPSRDRIIESLKYMPGFFGRAQCDEIQAWVDHTAWEGDMGLFCGPRTLDATPCRKKYFFGKGYTYGRGMRGREELLPEGQVDPIPEWMRWLVLAPLEHAGVVPPGFVDSIVMNDYLEGSSIVAHVDPPSLFVRPIVTVTFFHPAKLVFGASFDPERRIAPVYSQLLERGSVLILDGYAANAVTHGIRPEDILGPRRVSLVLRKVIKQQVEPPYVPMPPPVPFHTALMLSWALLSQMQGFWYSETGKTTHDGCSARTLYMVHGLTVTAASTLFRGKAPPWLKSKKPAQDTRTSLLQIVPTEHGLMCQNLLLTANGVCPRTLTWCCLTAAGDGWHPNLGGSPASQLQPKNWVVSSTCTWFRLQN